jgi:hypothetical protein
LGSERGDAVFEVRLVRRLADHEQGPAELLEKEVGGLDVGGERGRNFAVGLRFGFEATVGALVGEGDVDATPGVVGGGEIAGDHGGDHGAAAAALRAGLDPEPCARLLPVRPLASGTSPALRAARRPGGKARRMSYSRSGARGAGVVAAEKAGEVRVRASAVRRSDFMVSRW